MAKLNLNEVNEWTRPLDYIIKLTLNITYYINLFWKTINIIVRIPRN